MKILHPRDGLEPEVWLDKKKRFRFCQTVEQLPDDFTALSFGVSLSYLDLSPPSDFDEDSKTRAYGLLSDQWDRRRSVPVQLNLTQTPRSAFRLESTYGYGRASEFKGGYDALQKVSSYFILKIWLSDPENSIRARLIDAFRNASLCKLNFVAIRIVPEGFDVRRSADERKRQDEAFKATIRDGRSDNVGIEEFLLKDQIALTSAPPWSWLWATEDDVQYPVFFEKRTRMMSS